MLLKLGFYVCVVGLIMSCVISVTCYVLVNGIPLDVISPNRCIRQKCLYLLSYLSYA